MNDKIIKVLSEKVDPVLASHFGGIKLTAFKDGIAYVKMTGVPVLQPNLPLKTL